MFRYFPDYKSPYQRTLNDLSHLLCGNGLVSCLRRCLSFAICIVNLERVDRCLLLAVDLPRDMTGEIAVEIASTGRSDDSQTTQGKRKVVDIGVGSSIAVRDGVVRDGDDPGRHSRYILEGRGGARGDGSHQSWDRGSRQPSDRHGGDNIGLQFTRDLVGVDSNEGSSENRTEDCSCGGDDREDFFQLRELWNLPPFYIQQFTRRKARDLLKATPRSWSDATYCTTSIVATSAHPIANMVRNENAMAASFFVLSIAAIAPMKAVIQTLATRSCQRTRFTRWKNDPRTMMPAQAPKATVDDIQAVSSQPPSKVGPKICVTCCGHMMNSAMFSTPATDEMTAMHEKPLTSLKNLMGIIGRSTPLKHSHRTKDTMATAPDIRRPRILADDQGWGAPPHETPSRKSASPATRRNAPNQSTFFSSSLFLGFLPWSWTNEGG